MLKAAEQRYLGRSTTSEKNALLKQIKKLRDDIAEKEDDIEDIRARILERDDLARELDTTETTDTQRQPGESEHSFLIRMCSSRHCVTVMCSHFVI